MRFAMDSMGFFQTGTNYSFRQFGIDPVNDFNRLMSRPFDLMKLMVMLGIIAIIVILVKRQRIRKMVRDLSMNAIELTPEQFMQMRSISFGGRGKKSYALTLNYSGVYILHNKTKDLYYVGQGKQVLNRVNAHFTGHGNGDVYADYKYGDQFTIRTIALENSGFSSLNELERYCISYYHAYNRGYNKTRGNR